MLIFRILLLPLHQTLWTMSKKATIEPVEQSEVASLYTISFENDNHSEFAKFMTNFKDNARLQRDYQIILLALQKILENGVRKHVRFCWIDWNHLFLWQILKWFKWWKYSACFIFFISFIIVKTCSLSSSDSLTYSHSAMITLKSVSLFNGGNWIYSFSILFISFPPENLFYEKTLLTYFRTKASFLYFTIHRFFDKVNASLFEPGHFWPPSIMIVQTYLIC